MRSRGYFACLLFISLSAMGGGGSLALAGWGFDRQLLWLLLHELAESQVHQLLFAALKWALLGGLLGLLLAVLALFALRALGCFQSDWRHARWIRWAAWSLSLLACPLLLGAAGFWHGAIGGSAQVVTQSQLGTRLFPELGNVIADGIAALQVMLAETNSTQLVESNLTARVAAFRAGAREVNAPDFVQQLEHVRTESVGKLVAALEREAVARSSLLQTGMANALLKKALQVFSTVLVEKKLDSETRRLGIDGLYHAVRDRLVAEARRQGNPDTISRPELSTFIVHEALVPAVLKPIRSFAGSQRTLFGILAVLAAIAPAVIFRLTCGRVRSNSSNRTTPT